MGQKKNLNCQKFCSDRVRHSLPSATIPPVLWTTRVEVLVCFTHRGNRSWATQSIAGFSQSTLDNTFHLLSQRLSPNHPPSQSPLSSIIGSTTNCCCCPLTVSSRLVRWHHCGPSVDPADRTGPLGVTTTVSRASWTSCTGTNLPDLAKPVGLCWCHWSASLEPCFVSLPSGAYLDFPLVLLDL